MCIRLITATPPYNVHAILFAYFDLKVLSSEMDPAVIRLMVEVFSKNPSIPNPVRAL
jgi:hypothetical protein